MEDAAEATSGSAELTESSSTQAHEAADEKKQIADDELAETQATAKALKAEEKEAVTAKKLEKEADARC